MNARNPLFSIASNREPSVDGKRGDHITQEFNVTEFSIHRFGEDEDGGEDCEEEVKLWDERVCESMLGLVVDGCDIGEQQKRGGSVVDGRRCFGYSMRVWYPYLSA